MHDFDCDITVSIWTFYEAKKDYNSPYFRQKVTKQLDENTKKTMIKTTTYNFIKWTNWMTTKKVKRYVKFLTVNFQYDLKNTEQHWYYCHLDNLTFIFQRFFFMKSSLENLTWLYLLFSTRAPHRLNLLRFFRQNLSRPPA